MDRDKRTNETRQNDNCGNVKLDSRGDDNPPVCSVLGRQETADDSVVESEGPTTHLPGDQAAPSRQSCTGASREMEDQVLDEIQSIQEYMEGLLRRSRGNTAPATVFAEPSGRPRTDRPGPQSETPAAHDAATPGATASETCAAPAPLTELTARSQAPESSGWVSMRELANTHARAVLDTHNRTCLARRALSNGAACAACLIGTVVSITSASVLGPTMRVGRMAGIVASVYFLYVSFVNAREWLIARSANLD